MRHPLIPSELTLIHEDTRIDEGTWIFNVFSHNDRDWELEIITLSGFIVHRDNDNMCICAYIGPGTNMEWEYNAAMRNSGNIYRIEERFDLKRIPDLLELPNLPKSLLDISYGKACIEKSSCKKCLSVLFMYKDETYCPKCGG